MWRAAAGNKVNVALSDDDDDWETDADFEVREKSLYSSYKLSIIL